MSNRPWVSFFPGDYLADTMHLSTFEHGIYMLLLMQYWRNGPLINDPERLALISRVPPHLRNSVSKVCAEFFTIGVDGLLHQKRADEERQKSADISGKRATAARAMHDKRLSNSSANAPANAPANGHAIAVPRARGLPQSQSKQAAPLPPNGTAVLENRAADPFRTGMADLKTVEGHPCVNGFFVDVLFGLCTEAGRMDTPSSLAAWQPIVGWLTEGYTDTEILWLIRRLASRPEYRPPRTLAYFSKAVHEDCKPGYRPNGFPWHE